MTRCFIVSLLQNPKQVNTVLSLSAVGIFFFFFFFLHSVQYVLYVHARYNKCMEHGVSSIWCCKFAGAVML